MKRSLAYITAAWRGDPAVDMEQAAHYCRVVYDAGYSPICPMLYLPLFLNDAVPEEHKNGIDMGRDLLRRSRVLVVCGHTVTESMKNDIAVAQRLGITATTLEGILTVKDRAAADMASLFEAYITNLGKYNEGELVGETLKFPTTTEEVQALLKRIGVDGVRYEEFFITSFDGDVLGLYDYLGEYENLDELNHLACLLSELDQGDLEKFEAVIDSGEHTSSVADLINLAQNLDCYEFYPGVENDETLGRIYVEDMEAIDIPDHLLPYFDYEAYGRDVRINEDGHFAPGGYVLNNGGKFIEHYHGIEDIPAEHKVFAFPQLSVREQMAAYKEIIDGSSLEGYRKIAKKEHEER